MNDVEPLDPQGNSSQQFSQNASQAQSVAQGQNVKQAQNTASGQSVNQDRLPVIPQQTVLTVQAPRNRARTAAFVAATALCIILCFSAVSCTALLGGAVSSLGLDSESASIGSAPKIAVISIGSTIQYDGTSCSPSGLNNLLEQAKQRDDIKGVVLRINSGGGTATAGEEMAKYVRDFEKPIVVSCAATTASAAYEIASQADFIYAAKTSSVGSIGVAMQVTDLSGLYEKLGISIDTIVSSEAKDSTYGNRALTKSERDWYQNMVNQIDADFIETVAVGRNMPVDAVRQLANGLTFTGTEAVANGLANEVGYLEDAILKASELAGYDSALIQTTLTLPSSPSITSFLDLLGEQSSGSGKSAVIEDSLLEMQESK